MESEISIIIPVWNEEKIILKTSSYLRKLKLPFKYSELIFVAGGTDNTYNICREIRLNNFDKVFTLKQDPGDFKSGALIKGIKKAKGANIILLDADVFVAPNLGIEIVKSLKKFDAVNCNFIPMMKKGFWYNYYSLLKLYWARNPNNLPPLIGGATISLKREVLSEIGIENFFTSKSKAGVDYYMSRILKKNNKSMGFVKNTHVLMPRPNNLRDFSKDYERWFNAFVTLHQEDKWIIISKLILSISFCLISPLIFLSNLSKMIKISEVKYPKIKYFFTLFFVEFLINLQFILTVIKKYTGKLKHLGHFKGLDRYLT